MINIGSSSTADFQSTRPLIAFRDKDLLDGHPNKYVSLLFRETLSNFKVRSILIDNGSLGDIIYTELLTVLGISEKDITPYRGNYLSRFNGYRPQPLGYILLISTFGDEPLSRSVKTYFTVRPCKSIYSCIIGRSTLGQLGIIALIVHLKTRFHSNRTFGKVLLPLIEGGSRAGKCFHWKFEVETLQGS